MGTEWVVRAGRAIPTEVGERRTMTNDEQRCQQCETVYVQPFREQPLRLLWWLDDWLHRRHVPWWLQRWTCEYVDRQLREDLPSP